MSSDQPPTPSRGDDPVRRVRAESPGRAAPHPFFGANTYPWNRPDAKELARLLSILITDTRDITNIYEQAGGDRQVLDTSGTPQNVWHRALSNLAGGHRLRDLVDNLEAAPRFKGNGDLQAALRAVRVATPTGPGSAARRRPIVLIAIVIALIVVVVIASFVAQNVFKVDVPWIPGSGQASTSDGSGLPSDPDSIARLQNGPQVLDAGGLITTIERVDQVGDVTEIELTVQNNLSDFIILDPAVASLASADGTTVAGDPLAGEWTGQIPAGQLRRGTLVMAGVLPGAATNATFSFAHVFAMKGDGPASIIVPGLALAEVPE